MNPGEVIDQRYRLERLVGTGGMAEVWLAEDQRLGRWVAVKVLRESLSGDEALMAGLEREARMIARLQHPNVVSVFDVGTVGGRHYLVMEYVHGVSLRRMIDERGQLTEAEVVKYGVQVAAALEYAHRQGVIHNDIKPENIIVTESGDAKVTDFGVAEPVTQTLPADQARELLGTIAYLAPEVIQGGAADARSDLYSLALTLYEAAAGRMPWTGPSAGAIAAQRLATPAPPLRSLAPGVSPGLETVLNRSLAMSPRDRFSGASDFGAALRQASERPAQPVPAPAPIIAPPARLGEHRSGARRPARPPQHTDSSGLAIIAVVVAILLALGGIAVLAFILVAQDDNGGDAPTPTPTEAPEETATPTTETVAPPTDEPTPTPTETPTEEPTQTPTATPEPTNTPEPTATPDD